MLTSAATTTTTSPTAIQVNRPAGLPVVAFAGLFLAGGFFATLLLVLSN
jgi:hypothetical protein